MSIKTPVLTVIIPSKDRKQILAETLNHLYKALISIDAEVIIVNDSKTNEIQIDPKHVSKFKVVNNSRSGVASARNLGATYSKADTLIFMDDDMWVNEQNIITTLLLVEQFSSKPYCFNLNWVYPPGLQIYVQNSQFGRYLHYYGFDTLQGWCRGLPWEDQSIFATPGITSQYLVIRKVDFELIGGYNEEFPHAGFEDHDFSQRLQTHHIQPHIVPYSMMYHNEADRMNLVSWLARKRRGGETRKVAVTLGYKELVYEYGTLKGIIYTIASSLQPLLLQLLKLIPNNRKLDKLYFFIVNLLLGSALYTGYQTRPKLSRYQSVR